MLKYPSPRIKIFLSYWLPIIIYCLAIFIQSSLPASERLPAFPHSDKLLHAGAYALLGFLFYRAFQTTRIPKTVLLIVLISALSSTVYGISDEIHQYFVPSRTFSLADMLANTVGSFIGAALAQFLFNRFNSKGMEKTMRAIVYEEYGGPEVLHLKELEKPVPKDNEVCIKVHATTVNYGDLTARNFRNMPLSKFNMPLLLYYPSRIAFGYFKPKINILGSEFSGIVEAIGKDVKRFKPDDPVYGYRGMNMGAYAEYVCMPAEGALAKKPVNLSHAEASVFPYGAIVALNLLRKANVQKGEKVLINGASGGIGSQAVQLAKYFGAHVTGVCGNRRIEFVKSLGADEAIDYSQDDFTTGEESYDLIFDILGRSSFASCKRVLNPEGRYLLASFKMKQLFQMLWTKFASDKKVICTLSSEKAEDLDFITGLIEAGHLKAVIDRRFPLEQATEAHQYVENGHKKGQIVITLTGNSN